MATRRDGVWLIVNPVAGGGRARTTGIRAHDALATAGVGCRTVQPTSAAGTTRAFPSRGNRAGEEGAGYWNGKHWSLERLQKFPRTLLMLPFAVTEQ